MTSNCPYHKTIEEDCPILECNLEPKKCSLYLATQAYNITHSLPAKFGTTPLELLISNLTHHHFNQLQEIVVLEAIGWEELGEEIGR